MQTPNIDRTNLLNFQKLNKVKKKVKQSDNIDYSNLVNVKKTLQFDKLLKNSPKKQSDENTKNPKIESDNIDKQLKKILYMKNN